MELLYSLLVFAVPATLEVFIWRDIAKPPLVQGRKRRLLIISVATLSCNFLLFWVLFVLDLLTPGGHPPSQAGIAEHNTMLAILWGSWVGILASIVTVTLAFLSERRFARKLCLWASSAALVCWALINIVVSDLLEIYTVYHR
jgi:hypothetical protein